MRFFSIFSLFRGKISGLTGFLIVIKLKNASLTHFFPEKDYLNHNRVVRPASAAIVDTDHLNRPLFFERNEEKASFRSVRSDSIKPQAKSRRMGRAMRVIVVGGKKVGKTAILRQVACVEDITNKAADAVVLFYSSADYESFNRVDSLKKWLDRQFGKDKKEEQLGDVVFIELPDEGTEISKGDSTGAVESVKAASDIYAPISGTVTQKNVKLEEEAGLINKSPFEKGWLYKLKVKSEDELKKLLTEQQYEQFKKDEEAAH
ncbi:hypothetical protein CRE_24143 [Caenorhabditis remanei]|uniref:Glycine cleavage system H protein, mitochondrial n=1 Tax=Caenorhabditis remanei TaxID=31234 RepID=E3N466_CAERE|nr:hypothetical protein CRE_24143 [Caenorhabditis remanei]